MRSEYQDQVDEIMEHVEDALQAALDASAKMRTAREAAEKLIRALAQEASDLDDQVERLEDCESAAQNSEILCDALWAHRHDAPILEALVDQFNIRPIV